MKYKEFCIQYALGTLDHETLTNIAHYTTDKKILRILRNHRDENYKCNCVICAVINNPKYKG
jgi:hypothetical protein